MGDLIYLDERRAPRPAAGSGVESTFYFDLGSPFAYLTAERIERVLGDVRWVPAPAHLLAAGHRPPLGRGASRDGLHTAGRDDLHTAGRDDLRAAGSDDLRVPGWDALRAEAETRARALRLPLVWPDRHPAAVPCAMRAATYACEQGAGARFTLAAARLAFCGGFDLEDPETIAEAASAAGLPPGECLAAASDPAWDAQLAATAEGLRSRGVFDLPAIRIGRRWFHGQSGLLAASAARREASADRRPLAPVG